MPTEKIFEPHVFTRSEKKRIRDRVEYYRKNKMRLLTRISNQPISFHQYDVVPVREYFDFEYKASHTKMANLYVDRDNFLELMAETLYLYEHSTTSGKVSKKTGRPAVIPYSDVQFYRFFMLKLITVPSYQIPLLLDHHYQQYSNKDNESDNNNNLRFLQFVEFQLVQNLERFSPFNYELQGIEVVKWLREKKRKYRNISSADLLTQIRGKQNKVESKTALELASLLHPLAQDHFQGVEKRFMNAGFIKVDRNGKRSWAKKKDKMIALILLLNKHNYFTHDLLESANKKFKAQVKTAFEHRFSIRLDQHLELARIVAFDLTQYAKIKPFSSIAPPISFDKI